MTPLVSAKYNGYFTFFESLDIKIFRICTNDKVFPFYFLHVFDMNLLRASQQIIMNSLLYVYYYYFFLKKIETQVYNCFLLV